MASGMDYMWFFKYRHKWVLNSSTKNTREYKVGEAQFHVFSVQNSKNELFLIVFGKNYDCSIRTAAYKVFQRSNSKPKKEKYVQKVQKHRK